MSFIPPTLEIINEEFEQVQEEYFTNQEFNPYTGEYDYLDYPEQEED
jgi:hypothetical protein